MDAELTGFVAGGGNDTALIGPTAYDHRFAAKFGALEEFDGDEKGVHVHVEDGRVQGKVVHFSGIVFGSETSEVRHAFTVRKKADSWS
jgi:ribosomal protein L19